MVNNNIPFITAKTEIWLYSLYPHLIGNELMTRKENSCRDLQNVLQIHLQILIKLM